MAACGGGDRERCACGAAHDEIDGDAAERSGARLGGLDERFFLYYEDVDFCRRAWAAGAAAVVGVETYVAAAFVAQIDALSWLRYLSPFHYYDGGEPLANGLQLRDALVLAAVTLALAAAGLPAYLRRDVGR